MGWTLRDAVMADCEAMSRIYNFYVTHATCTLATEEETLEQRRAWFTAHDAAHPILVAEENGEVLGWASLSVYNSRCGYKTTVEDSIYLRDDQRGKGLGRALLTELVHRAEALGHHTIMAGISGDQQASAALHATAGFTQVGRMREVGFKFNRWIDVIYMQRMLTPASGGGGSAPGGR